MSHQYLILGLLADSPMTGYDIKKQVNALLSDVTSASYGTLYPTLHKLLEEGAVEVYEVPQRGRPSKKIYRITALGQERLSQWLVEPASADQVRREFLLKLYLAKDLDGAQLRQLIDQRQAELTQKLKDLHDEKCHLANACQHWVFEYILVQCEAELDWLKQIEARIGVA